MGGRIVKLLVAVMTAAFALAACGGGSGSVLLPPVQTSGAVTFSYAPGLVCCPSAYTITVQPNGAATKNTSGSPAVSVQLSAALTQQIFSDLQKAWPLNSLTLSAAPDSGAVTVAWAGQLSPNIVGAASGIEGSLNADSRSVSVAFGP